MTVVEILVLKGAMASSVAVSLDVPATANRLRAASGDEPPFSVRVAGSGAAAARAIAGLPRGSPDARPADLVVVPGLGMRNEREIAARLAAPDAVRARRTLLETVARGGAIAASCSSSFLLAAAGLLDGRRATTTWWLAPLFRRLHPAVRLDTEALVVVDGPVTTAGAAMAQTDLMLSLVARWAGPRLADRCARYLLLDQRRSQSRYMALGLLSAGDERVARAQAWACAHLASDFSVEDLAAAVALSPRTFARRVERVTGLSPVRFLRRLRVERAVELLETTRLPFEEIARQVGYAEPTTLRRALRHDLGRGPRDLRAGPGPFPVGG
jgi:transcriptional regulator GlxA family with amidase domain